jgi:hypothetical protein
MASFTLVWCRLGVLRGRGKDMHMVKQRMAETRCQREAAFAIARRKQGKGDVKV